MLAGVSQVLEGSMEVDETSIGGLQRNKHEGKKLNAGRYPVGEVAVVTVKDRGTKHLAAEVIDRMVRETLQCLVDWRATPGATA